MTDQINVIRLPSRDITAVERFTFLGTLALCVVFFLEAAFMPTAESMRGSAAFGWGVSSLLTLVLWRCYAQARRFYVDNILAAQIFKQLGIDKAQAAAKRIK